MKAYLATKYDRYAEMQGVRDFLVALGHTVTSTWHDQHEQEESAPLDQLNSEPDRVAKYARLDIDDLRAADTVISFTGQQSTGGRHVELGLAIAMDKRLIVVGPREHVFHALPQVEHYRTWRGLASYLSQLHVGSCR